MMKNKFKKIMSVVSSVLMVGMTAGVAVAAGGGAGAFPSPFVQDSTANYALVYGANAATSDVTAANSINAYLNTLYAGTTTTTSTTRITGDFSSSSKETIDEIELGDSITEILTDNKVSSLIDYDFRWDNGIDSKNYDVHEEIHLNGLKIQTTLDNDELNTSVVLENDEAVEYRYVFDDTLNMSQIRDDDADSLYITVLGIEYEVINMDTNSITVSSSTEKIVSVGSTMVVDGVTLKIGDIFDEAIEINGVLIDEERKKTVDGIEVYVDAIAYHSSSTLPSKAILKVGKDIEQTFDDGDEYVDGDETWVWQINGLGTIGGFIGVKYNIKSVGFDDDEDQENAVTVGQSYVLPENYGAVSFDELTDVTYEDFELSFDDKKLYDTVNDKRGDVDVVMIKGENDDSIKVGNYETDSIYLEYNSATLLVNASVNVFFKDIDGDVDPDNEGRNQFHLTYNSTNDTSTHPNIARLVVDDTELELGLVIGNSTANTVTLTLTEPNGDLISIPLGISSGKFKKLGDDDEDAESDDVVVDGTSIGTKEDDIMDHYGLIIRDPESYADDDRVLLKVPSEQVYATISVKGKGTEVKTVEDTNVTTETPVLGGLIVKDTEINSVKDKNIIVLGGSCINSVAAKLLGLPEKTCAGDFSAKTNVWGGQFLIDTFVSPYNSEKVALLVAGYEAADTINAAKQVVSP